MGNASLRACSPQRTTTTTRVVENIKKDQSTNKNGNVSLKPKIEGSKTDNDSKEKTTETITVTTGPKDCGNAGCRDSRAYDHRHAENDKKYGEPKGIHHK